MADKDSRAIELTSSFTREYFKIVTSADVAPNGQVLTATTEGGGEKAQRFRAFLDKDELPIPSDVIYPIIRWYGDEVLVASSRANGASSYLLNKQGDVLRTFSFGDGIGQLDVDPHGNIWIGYFDEGISSHTIGREGLVAFSPQGEPFFKFHEKYRDNLKAIDDCYMLNVDPRGWVLLCYYSGFPIVRLDFSGELLEKFDPIPEKLRGFAIGEGEKNGIFYLFSNTRFGTTDGLWNVVVEHSNHLFRYDSASRRHEEFYPARQYQPLPPLNGFARGQTFILHSSQDVYTVRCD